MRTVAAQLALVAAMCGAAVAEAWASPGDCVPSVRVTGDAAAADALRAALRTRGLGPDEAPDCPGLRAHVERRDDLLVIEVIDGYGRRSQRTVRDTGTAVALVESWARPEVVVDDLPAAAAPTVDAAASTPAAKPAAAASVVSIALAGGMARDDGDAGWYQATLGGCGRVAGWCAGGRVAAARDARLGDPSFHPRSSVAIAATVERELRRGRFALAPAVGVGVAWSQIGALGVHMDQTSDDTTLRVLAGLAGRWRLAGRWSIEVQLGGERAFGADVALPVTLLSAGAGLRVGL